jgi:DNA-binding Lrp family transcriptional regulator
MADSDNLYSRILRELYSPAWLRRSGRESYVELARKLEIDDQTVRSTIRRMQESGFLKSWTISLNPHVLGMNCASVLVAAGEGTRRFGQKIVSQLKLIEGVVAIFSFLDDPGFRLVFFYQDEEDLKRKSDLVASICEANKPYAVWKIPFPPSTAKLKKTDWQIMRFLFKNSRKNVFDISDGIAISERTVRRRLDVLTENSCFFLSPVMDVKKVDGFLYHCVILFDNKKEKELADELLQKSIDRVVFADTSAESYSVLAAICRNISEARNVFDWISKQKGVRDVKAGVLEDLIFVRDWMDHELEKRA